MHVTDSGATAKGTTDRQDLSDRNMPVSSLALSISGSLREDASGSAFNIGAPKEVENGFSLFGTRDLLKSAAFQKHSQTSALNSGGSIVIKSKLS